MVTLNIERYVKKQVLIGSCLYIGQMIAGYSLGWSSPVIPKLQDYDQTPLPELISVIQASWVGSTFNLGMIFGPHISGHLCNVIGRKPCLILAECIHIGAQIILAFAVNLPMIFAGRILSGIGTSIISVVNAVYIGEIASTNLRGIMLTTSGIFDVLGSLLAYSVGPFVSYSSIAYFILGISIVHLACMFYIPESPMYYLLKDNKKAALNILNLLGREDDFNLFVENAKQDQDKNSVWKDLIKIKSNRKSLIITTLMMMFQLGSGILAVAFFATTIFQRAGSSIDPGLATIITGLTQFLGTLVVPFVVDKAGRRTLLLLSAAGCCLSTTLMGYYFFLDKIQHPSVPTIGWLPLVTLIFMLISFSIGLNVIPNTLMGEMFRPKMRSVGSSVAMTCGCFMGFLSVTTFGYLVEAVGNDFTFWIFAAINAFGFVFVILFVPETKGKSLIEIQEMLSK